VPLLPTIDQARASKWRNLMREDLAALNVTRTYTLASSNIAIFTFMLFFLYPRFESGRINPVLFQATLIAMGVATFSLVFATLHYYRCSLGGGMSDTDRALHARRADRFWLLGYTTMFLAPAVTNSSLKNDVTNEKAVQS